MYTAKLPLDGLPNTRDLGGLPTKHGAILPNRLIRSGLLGTASQQALSELLHTHQLRRVVDFRTLAEQREKPDPTLPGVEAISNPILKSLTNGISREEHGQTPIQQLTQEIHDLGITAERFMANLYVSMIHDEFSQTQYAKFFDILLRADEGATLWHCTVGKDRVGLGTAMLEVALGVSMDDVMDDYMATQLNVQAAVDRDAAAVEHALNDPEAAVTVRALNGVMPSYLQTAFAEMTGMCGSVEQYLAEKIGLTPEKCAKLQQMYIG